MFKKYKYNKKINKYKIFIKINLSNKQVIHKCHKIRYNQFIVNISYYLKLDIGLVY